VPYVYPNVKPSRLECLWSWVALPFAFMQGVLARRRSLRLPPADGPLTGTAAAFENRDEASGHPIKLAPINLLVIGDSSAQGVGVGATMDSLAAQLAREMNRLSGRVVHWRMAGANSATAADLRDHVVPHIAHEDFTHVLLTVGTNDAKTYHRGHHFCRTFGTLLYAVRTRFSGARIVWSPPIDMRDMPALQPFLGRTLQIRARLITANGNQLCFERGVVAAPALPVHDITGFAADGFHAGAGGCKYWAVHIAPYMLGMVDGHRTS
jgi:lysophospholipase L1-like esterase